MEPKILNEESKTVIRENMKLASTAMGKLNTKGTMIINKPAAAISTSGVTLRSFKINFL